MIVPFSTAVLSVARIRARRPAKGRRPAHTATAYCCGGTVKAKPRLDASPRGFWDPSVPITVRYTPNGDQKHAVTLRVGPGGIDTRWLRDPDSAADKLALEAIEAVAEDPRLLLAAPTGTCCVCKRPLSNSDSIQRGFGPSCAWRVAGLRKALKEAVA